jgi:hypothetical protein
MAAGWKKKIWLDQDSILWPRAYEASMLLQNKTALWCVINDLFYLFIYLVECYIT